MKNIKSASIIHLTFSIGLLLKALDAGAEIFIGVGLIFITPEIIDSFVALVSKGALTTYGQDWITSRVGSFFSNTRHFAIFYMLSHGILKMTVIIFLWRRKLWAYPLSMGVFAFFIIYQLYRFTHTHSIFLLLLTLLDLAMIILTIAEYRRLKKETPA